MKSALVFWLVPFLFKLTIAVSASCNSTALCPCGSSNYTYTLCIDSLKDRKNPCDIWSKCETCKNNLSYCNTCPKNRTGPLCLKELKIKKRYKRQYPTYPTSSRQSINPSFFGRCPQLKSPDLGSLKCRQTGTLRTCTGQCLPGYSFSGRENENEITLTCRRDTWSPRSFPPCISKGHCKIKIEGAGSYNCTTGMDGTDCDIFCDMNYLGRYHCFLGKDWKPELPYCAKPNRTVDVIETPPYPVRRTECTDPGIPTGTVRMNMDGTPAAFPLTLLEGQSLVFSCRDEDSALRGSSIVTCRNDGTWSASNPRCVRTKPSIICPDPGTVSNADRLNTDGSVSRSGQVYTPGQSVVYSCQEGYALRGQSMITCLRTKKWSNDAPRCTTFREPPAVDEIPPDDEEEKEDEITCSQPDPDVNGFIEDNPLLDQRRGDNVFPPGSQLVFGCHEGYHSVGAVILSCLPNGDWSSLPPTCEETDPTEDIEEPEEEEAPITCPHPGVGEHSEIMDTPHLDPNVDYQRFRPGTELTYTCHEGYELDSTDIIECLHNGEWSESVPTCIPEVISEDGTVKHCPTMGPISNGMIVVYRTLDEKRNPDDDESEYPHGTRLRFSCELGYTLIGRSQLVCRSTGEWSAEAPICVEDCGRSLLMMTHKLTGAKKTVAGEWPWMVGIAETKFNITNVVCGGALLDRRTVITAAHCLTRNSFYTLYFGKFHREDTWDDSFVERRVTTRMVIHKGFDATSNNYHNDIALLRFEPNIKFTERIQTICLPTPESTKRNIVIGNMGIVTGWGVTEFKRQSDELLMARLPIQPKEKCEGAFDGNIPPSSFCAGFDDGMTNGCTGDSGSPFVFYDRRTDRHTLEGIVSHGPRGQCDMPNKYTVFMKVLDFMPWILRNWPR